MSGMAQSHLIDVTASQKKKKNNLVKHLWEQEVYTHKNRPKIVYPYKLTLDKPIPNLKTIPLGTTPVLDVVTVLLPPKPTLVNLVDGSSPHIPSITKDSNTDPPKNPTPIIATNTAANTLKESSGKMGKKSRAKRFAALRVARNTKEAARQVSTQTFSPGAAQGTNQAADAGQATVKGATQTTEQGAAKTTEQGAAKTTEQGAAKTTEQGAAKTTEQGVAQPTVQGAAQVTVQVAAQVSGNASNTPPNTSQQTSGTDPTEKTNLIDVITSQKKNLAKHLWEQEVYPHKTCPKVVFPTPIPNLKTIQLGTTPVLDVVTVLLPPKPTLVNLVDGSSPHIPSITKDSNTDPPKNPTPIIATNTAANTIIESFGKMGKKSRAKRFAALRVARNTKEAARQVSTQAFSPGAAQGTNQAAGQTSVKGVAQATEQGAAKTTERGASKTTEQGVAQPTVQGAAQVTVAAQVSGNASNPLPNTSQQTSGTDPTEKTFSNQQKKKWVKFQQKILKKKAKGAFNTNWRIPKITCNKPAAAIKQKPSITLITKKNLQQEMVRQQLNWIKPDENAAGNVPGTSAAPHTVNQSVSPKKPPLIAEVPTSRTSAAPQTVNQSVSPKKPPLIAEVPTSTIPRFYNRTAEPTSRINAGKIFKKAAPSKPSPSGGAPTIEPYVYKYAKGIPRSFLLQQENSLEPSGSPITADSPIWPSNISMNKFLTNSPIFVQPPPANVGDNVMKPAVSPIFVQTESPVDVEQPYSPSDVYSESVNPEPPELESESSEQSQAGQKRLSAFQRLGPLSQPKKPKLTINLNLKKEQPVREVVNATDDDPDKYTPVHLRKDILMSTDETVVKYLPFWPWRKNITIRRSATARNSRSVMILEQEKMEEAYEKDNIYIQITVKGYPSTWTKERVLDAVLDSVKGYIFVPCFTEFYQHECKFLVLRSRSALVILHKTGFYIHKDGVELAITISIPILADQPRFIPRIILTRRIDMGYTDKKLNLSAFTLQEDVSHFVYFPLNRVSNQSECLVMQTTVDWNRLVELDLSHNRITNISGFDLVTVTPRLKHLDLSHNCLEKVTVLLNDRQLPLKTIHLEGNPLCHDYIDPEHYVKVIRMMFPAVVEIDGVPIHRKGELPNHKQNYCPEEAQEVAEKFLEIFFPLFDSGPDHRSLIQGMYEDDATLTITYCYKLRYGQIYRSFRNLFLYARFLDEGETDSVVGAMAITKLINRWPHTEHDPFTFTVDALYHTEYTTILRISGVLKLTAETLAEDEHLLSFTRTVVLHSEDGTEYRIQNEMLYWHEPSAAAARAAFRVNTISQKNFNLKIESTTDEDLRDKFLKIFMKLTTMDKIISERCLEINNWNFKLALEHFTKLLKSNNLDSLTQEVQAIS